MMVRLAQHLDHDPIKLNRDHWSSFCLSMIFFRKPVPTFRDHALAGKDTRDTPDQLFNIS